MHFFLYAKRRASGDAKDTLVTSKLSPRKGPTPKGPTPKGPTRQWARETRLVMVAKKGHCMKSIDNEQHVLSQNVYCASWALSEFRQYASQFVYLWSQIELEYQVVPVLLKIGETERQQNAF